MQTPSRWIIHYLWHRGMHYIQWPSCILPAFVIYEITLKQSCTGEYFFPKSRNGCNCYTILCYRGFTLVDGAACFVLGPLNVIGARITKACIQSQSCHVPRKWRNSLQVSDESFTWDTLWLVLIHSIYAVGVEEFYITGNLAPRC